jgi:regulator of replication initiation timing
MNDYLIGYWRNFEIRYKEDNTPLWFGAEKNEVLCELYREGVFVCKIFLDKKEIKETSD